MYCTRLLLAALILVPAFTVGCQATRKAGSKVGTAVVALPFMIAEGLIDNLFDSDETIFEQDRRKRRERKWKQYWRDHPDENRAMHEAFKDDYE